MTASKKQKSGGVRGGTLLLIASLMIGSALIRLALEAGPALAKSVSEENFETKAAQSTRKEPMEADLHQLLMVLKDREKDLDAREAKIMDRMKALEVAEMAIEKKLHALTKAEEALRATLALADAAAETDLTRLTSVYEKMKPKESAALFEEMDPTFAAGFLARMNPQAAAGIMAGLSPKAAYTISVVLAGRNATVPTE